MCICLICLDIAYWSLAAKSLESFLAGFETRALPVVTRHSDSASGALIGQAESQFKASMEACADVLDAFQDQCTQEEESLLQSAEEEDTRGALEERFICTTLLLTLVFLESRFIADWTRLHHGGLRECLANNLKRPSFRDPGAMCKAD